MQKEENVRAVGLGSLAEEALDRNSGRAVVGEVVSVFQNSLYVKTTDRELVFITSRPLKSPITLNLDSKTDFSQTVRPQEKVWTSDRAICLGTLSISLCGAASTATRTTLPVHEPTITRTTLHLACLILMIIDNSQSVLDQAALAHGGAAEFVSNGVLPFLQSNDSNTLLSTARKIVGLGTGFTPSCDDLLGGFLAAYNRFTPLTERQTIKLDLDQVEERTHWVSAKLLDYMQRQILDEQFAALIESSTSPSDDSFLLALQTMLPRGHTSGIDILVGVLLALGLVHDILHKDNATLMVAENLRLMANPV